MRRYILRAFISASFLLFGRGEAEIQKLVITWTPGLCVSNCIMGLDQQLRKVDGVGNVQINQASARADLQWKPNFPFSYPAVEAAMSKIGLSIIDISIKVHGTLSHDQNDNIWLTSIGDGTRFFLLSPIQPSSSQYVEYYNVESHKLTEEMRRKLNDAEFSNQAVTIEGPIFSPERAPPLTLIIQKLQVEDQKQQ